MKYGVGGKERQQKKWLLQVWGWGEGAGEEDRVGGELGREGDRDEGCKRIQEGSEHCQNALQCMFVSLPLPRRQYSCN